MLFTPNNPPLNPVTLEVTQRLIEALENSAAVGITWKGLGNAC